MLSIWHLMLQTQRWYITSYKQNHRKYLRKSHNIGHLLLHIARNNYNYFVKARNLNLNSHNNLKILKIQRNKSLSRRVKKARRVKRTKSHPHNHNHNHLPHNHHRLNHLRNKRRNQRRINNMNLLASVQLL